MIKKTGYLGPSGTYSQIAAKSLCADAELIAYASFPALINALKSGEVVSIVLPIENTLNGAVTQNLDLLQKTEGVYAKASCAVKIDHRLVTLNGAPLSEIKRIYSHKQALGQCAQYLADNFPSAKLIETPSTADSVNMIKSGEDAGIVGAHFSSDGYTLSGETISDVKNNYTQFILVENGVPADDLFSDRVFFSATCRHKVGALLHILEILRDFGINMTEIESRPIKEKCGEFRFFIEVEGNYADSKVKDALKTLCKETGEIKLLGCYVSDLPK